MTFPKTEKELEVYFKLCELKEHYKAKNRPYSLNYPHQDIYNDRYEKTKQEYFNLLKSLDV